MPDQVARTLWYCLEAVAVVSAGVLVLIGLLLIRWLLDALGLWP
jgi:hypothetical protein